jgi:RimJ/RimL family protein N-acetyltransferase
MIETERLVIRPLQRDDLPWILSEMNRPAVMRHLGGVPRSESEVVAAFESDLVAFLSGEYLRWTICSRDDGRRIGRIGQFRVKSEAAPLALRGECEIGWMLAETYWKQGFATEAAQAILVFGFETLGHQTIFSQTSDSNVASSRMMVRLGFERCPPLDYIDPEYPAADNPTTVYQLDHAHRGRRP